MRHFDWARGSGTFALRRLFRNASKIGYSRHVIHTNVAVDYKNTYFKTYIYNTCLALFFNSKMWFLFSVTATCQSGYKKDALRNTEETPRFLERRSNTIDTVTHVRDKRTTSYQRETKATRGYLTHKFTIHSSPPHGHKRQHRSS